MITVFGSINLDLVVAVQRLPTRGETVIGSEHQAFAGGKGSNQALAARRAGGSVRMVGAVGTDAFADGALENLKSAGVDLETVRRLGGATGLAFIGVEGSGENQIIVASGANRQVAASWLEPLLTSDQDTLLMQGEVPEAEIVKALEIGRKAGATMIWNPAPVPSATNASLVRGVDILVVNEGEAKELAELLGLPSSPESFIDAMATECELVVVTLGGNGVIAGKGTTRYRILSPKITVMDTTGAGDAFCGALSAAVDRGAETELALKEAVAAGSLACLATGAQSSAPDRDEIIRMAVNLKNEL
ncbi:ribokinase [Roseibium algae]|uniref:Ribokinase n=1 Tax=Roseibium algae TaxID=3123038 RepID=A0ABU8TPW7_9HYPH